MKKVFPDHWSFMLGEIALWSFVHPPAPDRYLPGTVFFHAVDRPRFVYNGSYIQARRHYEISQAYSSTLNMSFDVRGGLVMRQIHHWAALLFMASMTIHMFRVFFTGAFRKPRELNWLIGSA